MRVVECVPNISEGRDRAVIDAVAGVIHQVEGCELLDVDPGAATNRTVITFVGTPETVVEGAFQLVKKAQELIDMRHHSGEHPRFGATDVCPFVPVSGVDMDDCVELAHRLGQRLGEELGISGYFYENAARTPERQNLSVVRSGEYEALEKKLSDPKWKPDFGPATFDPKFGVVAVGAREFLIAYNVNVNTADKRLPHEIALRVREQGRAKRDENWQIVRDENGKPLKVPGRLKNVKGIGWTIEEFGTAQVSMNLVDIKKTPLHLAFEACRKSAARRGMRATGSELVGMAPLRVFLEAGRYFLHQQQRSLGVSEAELVKIAVKSLGLDELAPFDPVQKIIEYRLQSPGQFPLLHSSLDDFADQVASDRVTPAAGSAAAYMAALGAALGTMVANLSAHKRGLEKDWEMFSGWAERSRRIQTDLLRLVDEDARAFEAILEAMRLPKGGDEEKAVRYAAVQRATRHATEVPVRIMELALQSFDILRQMIERGLPATGTDAASGALFARAAARSAFLNVQVNARALEDQTYAATALGKGMELLALAEAKEKEILEILEERMKN